MKTLAFLLLLSSARPVFAQHNESPEYAPGIPRTDLEKQLQHDIICMCGTCGRRLIAECDCGLAAQMRNEVAGLVDQFYSRLEARGGKRWDSTAGLIQLLLKD